MFRLRKNKKKIVFLAGAFIAGGLANSFANEDIWSDYRTIDSVSSSGGNTVVTLSGAKIVSSSSCTNKFRVDANDPLSAALVGKVNAAHAFGEFVRVAYSSASTACEVLIFNLQIQ